MYEAVAQVVPVLLLALAFESRAVERIRARTKRDEAARRFWKRGRVRALGIFLCIAAALSEVTALLVLNDTWADNALTQILALTGTLALLTILLGRILLDVFEATPSDRP